MLKLISSNLVESNLYLRNYVANTIAERDSIDTTELCILSTCSLPNGDRYLYNGSTWTKASTSVGSGSGSGYILTEQDKIDIADLVPVIKYNGGYNVDIAEDNTISIKYATVDLDLLKAITKTSTDEEISAIFSDKELALKTVEMRGILLSKQNNNIDTLKYKVEDSSLSITFRLDNSTVREIAINTQNQLSVTSVNDVSFADIDVNYTSVLD